MITNSKTLRKASLLTASTLTVMAGAIVAPALPQISREFADVPGIELLSRLVLTLPALFMGVLAPLAGFIIDKAGRKKVLLVSLIAYALAGTTGLYFNNFFWILFGRALLGISVGALITAVITLIGDYFEGEERNRFMGLQAAFAGLGGLIFISAGGVLADIHWRMPFLIYILSLGVWLIARVSINEPIIEKEAPAVSPTGKPEVTGIPPVIFVIYIVTFLSAIVFYMIPVQMPFMLSAMEGVSNTGIGFAIAFVNLASVTTSLNYGRLRKYLSYSSVMGLVFLLVFAGFMVIGNANSYVMMIVGIAISGSGFGFMMPNINLWLISSAPARMRGRLVGYLNMALFIGMFASPIVLQPMVSRINLYATFQVMAWVLLGFSFVFIVYAVLKRYR